MISIIQPLHRVLLATVLVLPLATKTALAQADLPIYTDNLVNGFQDWGWASMRKFDSTTFVHSGTKAVSTTASAYQALWFHQNNFDTSPYANVSFWIHGGANGGQLLQVLGVLGGNSQTAYALPALAANTWKQFSIPLSSLGVASKTNFNGIQIQLLSGGSSSTFYVDDLALTAKPAPALVHLSVNAGQAIRAVEARWFGVNTAIWDSNFDTPETLAALREMGSQILRFPGGSLSDEYHWASNRSGTNTFQWATSFTKFSHIATNLGAQVFITVNYGTGTAAEAAAWVRHANVTNHFGYKYWEIGNECYGTWETDANNAPHDGYTYAVRAKDYFEQMRAADPTIKIGVVVAPDSTSYANGNTTHPAVDSRTHATSYGWTPVVLATLKSLGVTPDFLVHHRYPEYTGGESDPLLLQSASAWAADATDLRQQVSDYFGAGGTNIELLCTENNSNSGNQGRQSTSLVNALYLADSLGQFMRTEFNAFVWWDLRNGRDTTGSMDPTLYGWRSYGDLGMLDGLTSRYPTFYAMKMMSTFAQPGDSVIGTSSDYSLLSTYAVRRANGGLRLLVINRDTTATFNAQIALPGFAPQPVASVYSYGIPQDNAARTGSGSQNITTNTFAGAATSFTNSFAPLSLTVFDLDPAPPRLVALLVAEQFVFTLEGQPSGQYILQTSTNLTDWSPISTNTLTGSSQNFTNAFSRALPPQFWRAVWQP